MARRAEDQGEKGQPKADAAEMRRKVAALEHALRQAEEDRAQTMARIDELEHLDALEHEARLFAERIVHTVREPLVVLDEGLRVKTANRSFCETFRVVAEDTEGRLLFDLGDGQWNIPALKTLLEEVLLKNTLFQDFEVEHDFPTIGRRTMVLNARQVRWNGSRTPFILLAVEDFTGRKRAEVELRRMLAVNEQIALASLREREFADAIISSMAEGVIVYDSRGEVVRTNATARGMFGLPEGDEGLSGAAIDGSLLFSTPEGTPLPPEEQPAARALRGEKVLGLELALRTPGRDAVWVSASAAPINTPNGDPWGAVVALADVTALHELEEQREDILRAVSHDLRNPLTVVLGQAQIIARLLKNAEERARIAQSAERILVSGKRMDMMIQDLTDSLRLESGQIQLRKQIVDLRSLTAGLLMQVAEALEVERVRVAIPDGLPLVVADPERLERILVNLLSNALKYSPSESGVLVEAEARAGEVKVSVSDKGIGIPPEDLPHIFQRFHKTQNGRRGGGLGLGLNITQKFVEAHGGRILVQSKVDEGTTFTFTLPLDG